MLFSRVATFFFTFMTLGLVAFATPAPKAEPEVAKRGGTAGIADLLNIFNDLNVKVGGILPLISAQDLTDISSSAVIAPLLVEIEAAIQAATASLDAITSVSGLKKRQTEEDVANAAATLTTNIANTLGPLGKNPKFGPLFEPLIVEVDIVLDGLLSALGHLVPGILVTISGLLVDVAVTLKGLAFTLVVALLGL